MSRALFKWEVQHVCRLARQVFVSSVIHIPRLNHIHLITFNEVRHFRV